MEVIHNSKEFNNSNALTKALTKKIKKSALSPSSPLKNRVAQVQEESLNVRSSPLKGRIKAFSEQQKTLKSLKKPIEKAGNSIAIARYQVEMNQLLEFFEDERLKLDEVWMELSQKDLLLKDSPAFKNSESISLEMRRLYAISLEKSIHLDLNIEQFDDEDRWENSNMDDFFSSRRVDDDANVWKDLRSYYQLLESLMRCCLQYQSITQKIQNRALSI